MALQARSPPVLPSRAGWEFMGRSGEHRHPKASMSEMRPSVRARARSSNSLLLGKGPLAVLPKINLGRANSSFHHDSRSSSVVAIWVQTTWSAVTNRRRNSGELGVCLATARAGSMIRHHSKRDMEATQSA